MPTPFMHLDFAEHSQLLPALNPAIRELLQAHYSAFYLGNVAPDYQTICDIPREETHFYNIPPAPDLQAHELMLGRFPQLADVSRLPEAQAVFLAGYCAHLIQDLVWYRRILYPLFVQSKKWPQDRRQRFVAHSTLLTYLDRRACRALPLDAGKILAGAVSSNWLPFAADEDLHRWRDMLANQFHPGNSTETIAIYARRLGMAPAQFAANLDDPEWMDRQVFAEAPLAQIDAILAAGNDKSVQFINRFLDPVVTAPLTTVAQNTCV